MNKFTPRAETAMKLAREEAERLGHDHLDSEHLLLGMLALDKGIVVHVLCGLGVGLGSTRIQIEEMSQTESLPKKKTPTLTSTPLFEKILRHAKDEAKRMGHTYTGTEHLLLGILREDEGVAAKVLKAQRLDLEQVRREVIKQRDPDALGFYPGWEAKGEIKRMREEILEKIEAVIGVLNSLKTEMTQLRTDMLKGNS